MKLWKKISPLWLLILFNAVIIISIHLYWKRILYADPKLKSCTKKYNSPEDFEGFDNETGTENGCNIVPNYIHFMRYQQAEFTFVEMICVLAAFKNQKPDIIFFHSDIRFTGKYWKYLMEQKGFKEIVKLVPIEFQREIYGQPLSTRWFKFHGSDIARIQILMKYGGIYLDNDCFIVKSLSSFFKYELTLGWEENKPYMGNQVIIANKNARFLREWILSYKGAYKSDLWYYNTGERPVQEILYKKPELIHRMKKYFNDYEGMLDYLYMNREKDWRKHYVFHLLIRHLYVFENSKKWKYPVNFDEVNIKNYLITLKDMIESVYPL